jgi:hypothetical protein
MILKANKAIIAEERIVRESPIPVFYSEQPLVKVVALHVNTERGCARVFATTKFFSRTGSKEAVPGEVT